MCVEKNTVSSLLLQIQNDVAHFAPSDRIEPRHRLIEKHHLRIVQNRLRDARALQHAFREFSQLHVARRRQAHALEESLHALAPFRGRVSRKSRVIIEQLARGQVIVEIRLLRQIADLAVHAHVVDRPAAHARRARGREDQPHQQLQRRRFSGAVGPEKSENFALLDLQRQMIERPAHALPPESDRIILGQPRDFDGRRAHRSSIIVFFSSAHAVNTRMLLRKAHLHVRHR